MLLQIVHKKSFHSGQWAFHIQDWARSSLTEALSSHFHHWKWFQDTAQYSCSAWNCPLCCASFAYMTAGWSWSGKVMGYYSPSAPRVTAAAHCTLLTLETPVQETSRCSWWLVFLSPPSRGGGGEQLLSVPSPFQKYLPTSQICIIFLPDLPELPS